MSVKIFHILPNTAMNKGGLEFTAAEIISSAARQNAYQENVIAILDTATGDDNNRLSKKLGSSGTVYRLHDEENKSNALRKVFNSEKPDLVVFWLPEITHRISSFLQNIDVPLVVRASTTYDMADMSEQRKQSYRLCYGIVERQNGLVICNSDFNRKWNIKNFGLPELNQKVILGGVTLSLNNQKPIITRESLGIINSAYVVTNATRVESKYGVNYRKDPFGFILAASNLSIKSPDSVFVMCGEGAKWSNSFVKHIIAKANEITGGALTENNFKALGHVDNIDDVYALSDIGFSTAQSESFGRTIVEAMRHGLASIVTDTGVMPEMNGSLSRVIPVRQLSYDNEETYFGDRQSNLNWLEAVQEQFESLKNRSVKQVVQDAQYLKDRVAQEYDIEQVALEYAETYEAMLTRRQEAKTAKKPGWSR